ncbi:MAG: flagellar hook-length control protein FliK, partial [Desulfohalobiaceae bacterium]
TAAGEGESGAKVGQQARDLTMSGKGGEDSFGQGRARDGADDLWSKVVQTRSDQSPGAQIKTAPVHQVSPEAAATQGQTLSPAAARADLQAAAVNRGVYRMVESGIFQNLGQGRRQLTLRLSPPELGSLSVMLQVRNKDVQAVIRTSSDEAGRIVGEQLAQLRQSLENQGLKVSRLEVQTQLKDGPSSQGWMGADGHNQAREQQFETLSWVRRWLGTRQAEGDETAQGVQSSLVMEQISSDGLDIFA